MNEGQRSRNAMNKEEYGHSQTTKCRPQMPSPGNFLSTGDPHHAQKTRTPSDA